MNCSVLQIIILPMNSVTKKSPFDIVTTFCIVDDLTNMIFGNLYTTGRPRTLSLSETATIVLLKAAYRIADVKHLYFLLATKFQNDFVLPTYKNFVESLNFYAPHLLVLVNILLTLHAKKSGVVKIIDSTPLPVCKNIRIYLHKVMKSVATRSKTSTGWFYGVKLHLLTDLKNNILALKFTTANVGDRKVLNEFLDTLQKSIVVADAGYLSPVLETKASNRHNILLTATRKNMKKLVTALHIFLLNLRPRIESVFSVLKERLGLVTSLPRSVKGYYSHYIRTIFSYCYQSLLVS